MGLLHHVILLILRVVRERFFCRLSTVFVEALLGRRCVIMVCLFSSVALFGVLPYTAPNYPLLVFVKSLTFLLGSIVDAHPLIPDYIKSESRGKAVAISLLGSIIGEVFAMTVFIGMSINMDLNQSFLFVAFICGVLTCLIPIIVREPIIKPPV